MAPSGDEIWSIEVGEGGGLKIAGEIDYTVTPKVRSSVLEHIKKTKGELEVDLSELSYLDSSGLAVFIEARRKLIDQGRSLRITALTPQVKKIFQLTQVGQLFGV